MGIVTKWERVSMPHEDKPFCQSNAQGKAAEVITCLESVHAHIHLVFDFTTGRTYDHKKNK
jgi:hypothetical protein